MVDPGEKVAATAVREFREEATSSLTMSDSKEHKKSKDFRLIRMILELKLLFVHLTNNTSNYLH